MKTSWVSLDFGNQFRTLIFCASKTDGFNLYKTDHRNNNRLHLTPLDVRQTRSRANTFLPSFRKSRRRRKIGLKIAYPLRGLPESRSSFLIIGCRFEEINISLGFWPRRRLICQQFKTLFCSSHVHAIDRSRQKLSGNLLARSRSGCAG